MEKLRVWRPKKVLYRYVPTITSLLVALSPSPGEDQGVVDIKSKLKSSMVDRFGGKEVIERYSV